MVASYALAPPAAPQDDGHPLILEAEADSYVEFADPGDVPPARPPDPGPFGAALSLQTGWWDIAIGWEAMLRFARPAGLAPDDLVYAELRFEVLYAESRCIVIRGPCTTQILLHEAAGRWDEATVTGANRPGAGRLDLETVVTTGQARLDVTEAARAWLAGRRPNGWVLQSATLTDGAVLTRHVVVASRESQHGPRLVLYDRSSGYPTATVQPTPAPTPEGGPQSYVPWARR